VFNLSTTPPTVLREARKRIAHQPEANASAQVRSRNAHQCLLDERTRYAGFGF
jgi:hypothetical protein